MKSSVLYFFTPSGRSAFNSDMMAAFALPFAARSM